MERPRDRKAELISLFLHVFVCFCFFLVYFGDFGGFFDDFGLFRNLVIICLLFGCLLSKSFAYWLVIKQVIT